jgi:hypothetical protein
MALTNNAGTSTLKVGNILLTAANGVIQGVYDIDLQLVQDKDESKGFFYTITSGIDFDFHNRVATNIPIVVEANGSQTADLEQWWGTAGTEVAGIKAAGGAYFASSVGIGSTSPQATLDLNGYARLALNSSAPAACSSSNEGAIALTHLAQVCVCDTTPAWHVLNTGTACSW